MGRVVKILHDMGDRVKPGELLVLLETIDSDLSVSEAEKKLQADLAKLGLTQLPGKDFDVSNVPSVVQSRVALERARQNLARERSLNHRGASTVQDLQNAENDEKANEAALENAVVTARSTLATAQATKVSHELAMQRRADMEIRAPVPSFTPKGLSQPVVYAIAKRNVSEGQMLKEGDAVAEIVIENPLRLWANVPERFSADIKLDQPARIIVSSHPGRIFDGKVARINPSIDSTSRTFQAEISVPNDDGLLRPGGFAKASILTRSDSEAVTVPLESIVRFAGVSKVFFIEGDKAKEAKVETALEGPGWVEVLAKLPPEAQVVTTGQSQLADGTLVTIRTPEHDAAPAAKDSKDR
jgi:RND family efflux transporter MFP subunit